MTDHNDRLLERVAAEVDAMLDLFDASPLAANLRRPDTSSYFELPFSWDWTGVPVHGTIDLAYESGGSWHVVDFKTDDIREGALKEAASPYLPQLALYASALESAVGQRPEASLLFLRTGHPYVPNAIDMDRALEETRTRIDAGHLLEVAPSPTDDEPGVVAES